jgi:hypothetical protein
MNEYICTKCGKGYERSSICCGIYAAPKCERRNCENPGTKSIYGMGYLATVCQEHFDKASFEDRDAAIRFRYAE